jgi:hypothetical protein
MFATRAANALEQTMIDALGEAGRHLVVHGWTGVGKTSLVEHVCQEQVITYLAVECSGGFEPLMHHVLNRLEARASTGVVEATKASGEASGGVFGLFAGKMAGEKTSEAHFEPYGASLESLVADALIKTGHRVLFIDNLEDYSDELADRQQLCRLIKACSSRTRDMGLDAPKLIIAGPTAAVDALLVVDDAAARRTQPIEVPRMAPGELDQILVRGEQKLDVVFDHECRRRIIALSDGLPYYTHLYALQCSRVALRQARRLITGEDFNEALDAIVNACSGTLKEAYSRAIRARGEPSLRQSTLAAVAESADAETGMPEIVAAFLQINPQYERPERIRFLGRLLAELRDEHGILEDAWLEGHRGYRFRDPLMRVYVRLRMLRDRQLVDERWRASLPG